MPQDNDNIVRLPPRPVAAAGPPLTWATAFGIAIMERDICLEGAAQMAEELGRRISVTDPSLITPDGVAQCLASLAKHIRKLKPDAPLPAGPTPGGAA